MLSGNVVAYEPGVSDQRVGRLCNAGLVPGAICRRAALAILAEALPLIRDLPEQPVVASTETEACLALAKSEPAPVGMMTPPEVAAGPGSHGWLRLPVGGVVWRLGRARRITRNTAHSTWLFPADAGGLHAATLTPPRLSVQRCERRTR